MKKIKLTHGAHKGKKIIWIKFDYDPELIGLAKMVPNASWSTNEKSWYVPDMPQSLYWIEKIFQGRVQIEEEPLQAKQKEFVLQRKTGKPGAEVESEIQALLDWMRQKRYSDNTIANYCEGLRTFFGYFAGKKPESIDNEDLLQFNKDYILANNYSVSFQTQLISAIKLFFSKRHRKRIILEDIERPKKVQKLPNVVSKAEVRDIINAIKNLKHKTILALIYACGLRRSELLNLEINQVDSKRGFLVIRQGKGKKDRLVPLSEKMVAMLRKYYQRYRPKKYLFEGAVPGERYSEGSLQKILDKGKALTGLKKPFTLHGLRHSYATHLLEGGTDLRYIQEILGHKSSRTTEIYTHVSSQQLGKIKSPFDDLDLE